MRKLKLQMQITVNGFVAGPKGELDWMRFDKDDKLLAHIDFLTDSSDTILMGRKMADGFVKYWTKAAKNPESPEYELATKMVGYPKIVFTKTLDESPWENTVLAKGDIVDEVNKIKQQKGKDIVVYGGAGFVSSLIKHNLIDEYNFFVNPVAISRGMTIFDDVEGKFNLKQVKATPYECGVTVHQYLPGKAST